MADDKVRTEHHVWCNFFMRPVEGCRQCKGLWEKYPYDPEEDPKGLNLLAKHFPNVRVREGT